MAKFRIRESLTSIGTLTARPSAFVALAGFATSWLIFEPETLNWHGIATLATWAMTLLIQRAEHRDTQALQAKLDELIRSSETASDAVAEIDEKEPEEIEKARDSRRNIQERSRSDT
jgi:low affinity Fe/Cu permease